MKTLLLLLGFATLPMLLLVGCETESSSQAQIQVTPSTATLNVGESQEFIASGWTDYTWSLSDNAIGALSNTKGDRTVYTALSTESTDNVTTNETESPESTTGDDNQSEDDASTNETGSIILNQVSASQILTVTGGHTEGSNSNTTLTATVPILQLEEE